jgi:hypothetical protein
MLATHAAVRAEHGAHLLQALPAEAAELEALPAGCGWFDSSLDLSRGLAVVEHAGFDAIGDTVPLAWQLAPWL